MTKHPRALMCLLLLAISAAAEGQSTTNAWSKAERQPQVQSGQQTTQGVNPGLSSDIEDQIMRQQEPGARLTSAGTGLSPLADSGASGIDSRVAMLESSVNGIQKTLESVLDWLCQVPTQNNANTAAGSVMCQRNQKVNTGSGVVEELAVSANVDKVDRAPRTRNQATADDGWTTVGGGGTSGGNKQNTGGSSARPTGPITVPELQIFTEELLSKDTNNVASQIRINRQGQTNSRSADDKAQEPLVSIPSSALNKPTIVAFRALLDNYDPNVKVKDVPSNAEIKEQTTFLNELMKTQVMQHTEQFLTSRGKIRRPLKDVLKEIWFTMYKRAGRNEGSSGFEHSFIGELKDGKVSGFHNWIQFGHEEQDGDLDYKGFQKYVNLGNKGQIVKIRFTWMLENKPVGSLFVGTSPELELALYTVCFLVKPDQQCQVKLNNKKFNIQTWTQNYKGKKLIGSAYPDI